MLLRTRLLVGLLVLALLGMLAVGVGTYAAVRSSLLARVDRQLVHARGAVNRSVIHAGGSVETLLGTDRLRDISPPDTFVQIRDPANRIEATSRAGTAQHPSQPPRLTALSGTRAFAPGAGGSAVVSFDTRATRGSGRYRVQVTSLPGNAGILVAAAPLDSVSETLDELRRVELVITGAVLAALALGAFVLLRHGLRPLERMAETASGIAAGGLDTRIATVDPHSEVGRLGLALNEMLERLQVAFAGRDESEAQLRRFVASASHELRTPLTSIRGYAALFRRGAHQRPDDLAKAMARIESEATRMSGLLDDLLLLARLDERRPLERGLVDLTAIAHDAVRDALAREPDDWITTRSPERVFVVGDEQRLRQVAANLLANAQTHTPRGTPIEVALATRGNLAVLTVIDRGAGVAPDHAPHIFERFYTATPAREDHDRTHTATGSGLGLSIVAAIVDAHGGTVMAARTPGGGATFEVTLPLTDAPTARQTAAIEVPGPETR